MKLLILGGTRFVGRHLVDDALARGHEITLFNRGQSGGDLFPMVEHLRGNRDGELDALRGRRWDAVIDTCGYVPRLVTDSARLLADAVDHYTFISTISVYADFSHRNQAEIAPLGIMADPKIEEINGETYGPLKVLCERAAVAAMPGRVLTIRPGLIVGPYDPTDRFTYWPHRIAKGGEVLAPIGPDYGVEFIDARDLAGWTLDLIDTRQTGIYNATSPPDHFTLGKLLSAAQTAAAADAHFTWVDDAFLQAEEVKPWSDLPLYIGMAPEFAGFNHINVDKAVAAGLTIRPLAETVADTLAWDATRPPEYTFRAGLNREQEAAVLAAWHAQQADAA